MASGMWLSYLRPLRLALRGNIERDCKRSIFTTSVYFKTEPDLSVKNQGFMEKSKIHQMKKEDFDKLKKELNHSRSNAFLSFGVCALITYVYLVFKDENDRDIKANLKMLKNEESICMDTIAKMIISKPDKDSLMFRRRLKGIREEIELNEKKLEGLDLP